MQLPCIFSILISYNTKSLQTPISTHTDRRNHNSSIHACCYSLVFRDMQNSPVFVTTISHTQLWRLKNHCLPVTGFNVVADHVLPQLAGLDGVESIWGNQKNSEASYSNGVMAHGARRVWVVAMDTSLQVNFRRSEETFKRGISSSKTIFSIVYIECDVIITGPLSLGTVSPFLHNWGNARCFSFHSRDWSSCKIIFVFLLYTCLTFF